MSYGTSILVIHSTISRWIGGDVVELFIFRITTRLASPSIGCGEQENMGGSLGSTSPYDMESGGMDGIAETGLCWTLPSGSTAIWWELIRQMAHEFA